MCTSESEPTGSWSALRSVVAGAERSGYDGEVTGRTGERACALLPDPGDKRRDKLSGMADDSLPGKPGGGFLVPALLSAVATAGLGVAINFATEWKTSFWAWAAVAVITALVAGATLWLARRQVSRDPQE